MPAPGTAEPGRGTDGQPCGALVSKVYPATSKDGSGANSVPCSGVSVASRSTTASEASDVTARQLTATLHASLQAERFERMASFDLLKQDVETQREYLEALRQHVAQSWQPAASPNSAPVIHFADELQDLRSALSMQQQHQDLKFTMIEDALQAVKPCAPFSSIFTTEPVAEMRFRGQSAEVEIGRLRQDLAAFKEEQELVFSALQEVLADVRSDHERLLSTSSRQHSDKPRDTAADIAAAELAALQQRVAGIATAVDGLKGDLESEVARRCSNLAHMQSTMLSELADIRRRAENEIGYLKVCAECSQSLQLRQAKAAAALLEAAGKR